MKERQNFLLFFFKLGGLLSAGFQPFQSLAGGTERLKHLRHGWSILSFEPLVEGQAFIQPGQTLRVVLNAGKDAIHVQAQRLGLSNNGVEFGQPVFAIGRQGLQMPQRLPGRGQQIKSRGILFDEAPGHIPAQFLNLLCITQQNVFLLQGVFLIFAQLGISNFFHPVAQRIHLLGEFFFIAIEFIQFSLHGAQPIKQGFIRPALLPQVAVGVQNVELRFRDQQRLMIVRPVNIHQQVANALQHLKGNRRAVHPVLSGSFRADHAP